MSSDRYTVESPFPSPLDPWLHRRSAALLTDLYELTMMAGYQRENMTAMPVSFEFFFRDLPPDTGFAVFAGLEQLLDYIDNLRFEPSDIAYLRGLDLFPEPFLAWLRTWRCTCDIWAVPEGTLVFPDEPILRVEGPLGEAQLLETFILNALNYPTLIATKAARVCIAADGDPVMEFGLRRAQGPDGGLIGTRAAYIGGCAGTSNCLAGKMFGIPVMGTHAHSWVMAFTNELDAFRAYLRFYPCKSTLLVDTYDVLLSGVPHAITAFQELRRDYPDIRASIRIDSGDLAKLSKAAWNQLNDAGFDNPMIVASNDLDELLIADIKHQGAKINAWGVGTHLITSRDCPALNGVYKLTAMNPSGSWIPRIKLSSNITKLTNPGRKQVFRFFDRDGHPVADRISDVDDPPPLPDAATMFDQNQLLRRIRVRAKTVHPLLTRVVAGGHVVSDRPAVDIIRRFANQQIHSLHPEMTRLRNPDTYPVGLSATLAAMKRSMIESA
ncbi:nicotinate phosphoribosyltransferase [bacterium]|nr:nicotinate phosphoribosyltransferase [candidate division CSSED10-310 bacterium]